MSHLGYTFPSELSPQYVRNGPGFEPANAMSGTALNSRSLPLRPDMPGAIGVAHAGLGGA
jgi:hypothetical protein